MTTLSAERMSWDDIKALVAELAIQSQETDHLIRNLTRRYRDLGKRLGESVLRLFHKKGYRIHGAVAGVAVNEERWHWHMRLACECLRSWARR